MEQPSWETCTRDFRNYLRSTGRSDETARTYLSNVSLFWRWCAQRETDPRTVNKQVVRTYIAERLDKVSSQRAHNDIAGLRIFFAMCREDGIRDDNPTDGVSVPRSKTLPTEPITWEEHDRLLAACTNERDRLLVLFFDYSGMRVSEMAYMQAEHIDWRRGSIKVHGKGDKERLITPNPDILRRLHAFLGMFPSGPIWLSRFDRQLSAHQIRKILYTIAARARVENFHPHRARAFYATQSIKQFGDIQALQRMMGHASIETTARYTYFTRDERGQDQMRKFGAGNPPREEQTA
jgi:site-specific recombinase XerD